MENLEVVSTGLLNYHLKVLGDLLQKDDRGKYILTEKGKVASQLLIQFPYEGTLVKMRRWEQKFWKGAIYILVSILVADLVVYFLGYISLPTLYLSLLGIVPAICVIFVFEHFMRDIISERIRSKHQKINYYARGLAFGFLLWFVLIFALALTGLSREIGAFQLAFLFICLAVCCWIGMEINRWDAKRRNLELMK
jgi:glucose-6-phosphate-specific signal transduction histidine kinase